MSKLERRFITSELRMVTPESGQPRLEGYAAVFNQESRDLGGFVERVLPSAFSKTLSDGADVRALFNHDPNHVLGRVSSGTLRLAIDSQGLHYEVTPPNAQWARDLAESVNRGDITQSSFQFFTVQDQWETRGDIQLRELIEVRLVDVGPVTFPAYEGASVALRSYDQILQATQHLSADELQKLMNEIKGASSAPSEGRHADFDLEKAKLELELMRF